MGSTDKTKRMVSAVAATVVALAAGTNYAYSAWAPQFGERMKLSSTEVNFIGAAGNLGMYASGIPLGLLTDARGPRLTTLLGAITLGVGYYPVYSGLYGPCLVMISGDGGSFLSTKQPTSMVRDR
jgi:MFS family permease